ncbi:MAG: hypothetical protein JW965_05675 [Bacteroidales bacterium]|nr:hypothetical protein [Bacteroidales bacterium]
MKNLSLPLIFFLALMSCSKKIPDPGPHDLIFDDLASTWDEAIPLGNGMLGALVWKKDNNLRISLDRADLWDLRPMRNIDFSEISYEWVYKNWENDTYEVVQEKLDIPYNERPAPTKIPAGALEFNIDSLGETEYVRLYVNNAVCEVKWQNGTVLRIFLDATEQAGWFLFDNLPASLTPVLVPPAYTRDETAGEKNIESETNLTALGYDEGSIEKGNNRVTYIQNGWGGFEYTIDLKWKSGKNQLTGCWSISSEFPGWENDETETRTVDIAYNKGFMHSFADHSSWWDEYWEKSAISIPDTILEKQWYLEMYKFGSAARSNTPPIPLQGVWTADNGRLPPWKGDFHHDLNTQLSYWPSYSSNHVDIERGFVDWLWKYKPVFEKYTRGYFHSDGLNVPGVTTLTGEPMGGWIQYSMGPTVSAWLAHHFYLHWQYTMDREFLEERAYPWISAVAKHFDNITVRGEDGKMKLPISSSPEINDNRREAWFGQTTNFDLALIRWTYFKASELARCLGRNEEARQWESRLSEWPDFAIDRNTGLMIAPGHHLEESHRHFSHLMAWHPLGLLDVSNGPADKEVIEKTLDNLQKTGSDWWTGYSFSWLGNLYARAGKGDEAANSLKIFATAFCLPNSFHVNGDQSGKGYSRFIYRPFTLEGNFAFASGLQEMLLQSHSGEIIIFPAVPGEWENISYNKLRTVGAFLVSAVMEEGVTTMVEIISGAGGKCRLRNPFGNDFETGKEGITTSASGLLEFDTSPGEKIILRMKKD